MKSTKTKASATLPALQVEILQDGKRLRIVEIPDPRAIFCRHFNELELGTTARPLPDSEPTAGACCVVAQHADGRTQMIDECLKPDRAAGIRDDYNRSTKGTGWRARLVPFPAPVAIRRAVAKTTAKE